MGKQLQVQAALAARATTRRRPHTCIACPVPAVRARRAPAPHSCTVANLTEPLLSQARSAALLLTAASDE